MLNDNSPVNTTELAGMMRCCRATINTHKREGYRFEFGNRTTAGHYEAWLRDRAATRQRPVSDTVARTGERYWRACGKKGRDASHLGALTGGLNSLL